MAKNKGLAGLPIAVRVALAFGGLLAIRALQRRNFIRQQRQAAFLPGGQVSGVQGVARMQPSGEDEYDGLL